MAFKSKDLSVLAYANGFTLWHYTTVDLAADVDTAGYFNTACDMLRVGDMIMSQHRYRRHSPGRHPAGGEQHRRDGRCRQPHPGRRFQQRLIFRALRVPVMKMAGTGAPPSSHGRPTPWRSHRSACAAAP